MNADKYAYRQKSLEMSAGMFFMTAFIAVQ